ncbi:hypothetical protein CDL15_Pgr019123 [Punica granatum]|uniref:Uncharacterized protein n=1 Tax=Punica granatum TaxID=22663 RepID=A0A218XLF6_PUNGR|nr:hypothetical protein CDL15_Pgr019123 [Punica granatum]PKI31833.1 hypothetical protein CRG98_047784 [Punica granatum]
MANPVRAPLSESTISPPPLTPFSAMAPPLYIGWTRVHVHVSLETIYEEEEGEEAAAEGGEGEQLPAEVIGKESSSFPSSRAEPFLLAKSNCALELVKCFPSYKHHLQFG